MQDYTIGESYTLPSLGKVYSKPINPEITIRSMTTTEEMKRVASVDHPYKNMSDIIDACLVQGPGISAQDMCIGDYQFLLHKLRIVTYGPEYSISNRCIYCGTENQDIINLEELAVKTYTDDFENYREFDLPKTGKHIRLYVQTPRMLDRVDARIKEFKRKSKGQDLPDPSLIYIMAELIAEIDGGKPEPVQLENWLRQLPMADTNTIIQCAEAMNSAIGIDTNLTCTCDVCGLSFNTSLRTTAEFFRPALNLRR